MKVNGRKRRHEVSSDEEDDAVKEITRLQLEEALKKNKRLTDRVKELEKSLVTKSKESVEVGEVKKQLEEAVKENKSLMDRVKGLEKSLASKTRGEERRQLKEERGQFEEEMKTKVEQVKVELEEGRVKVEKEKVQVEKEKVWVEEERVRVEEEKVKVEKMLKEQQNLVECPVCLTLPREDRAVPCCPQGHFVCSPCMDQLTR